jgi:predicted kinase
VQATDDQAGVVQVARQRCRELLRSGRSFAFNATNLLRQTRQRWIDLFADYRARIHILYVEPPPPVILDRNRRRDYPVPEDVIRGLAARCEPPTLTEAHGLTVVSDG